MQRNQITKDIEKLKPKISQIKKSRFGSALSVFIPQRDKVLKTNIDKIFGAFFSESDKKHLTQAIYHHFILMLKELLISQILGRRWVKKKVQIQGVENLVAALNKNKGAILLTGHFGNWELGVKAMMYSGVIPQNQKVFCIRKPLKNKFIQKVIFNYMKQADIKIIIAQKGLTNIIKALKKKKYNYISF